VSQIPDARSEDNVFATENACAAIAKILHYNASQVRNPDETVARWIDTLPIVNDEEAAPYAYLYLSQLIDQYVSLSLPFAALLECLANLIF
jgi:importin-5